MHAYAAYGKPKYPPGFTHFDYVNPDAPKGGTLNLNNPDRQTSFDKFNPYTVKGNYPTGVRIFMFETLAVMAGDELSTMYGLLAESMLVAPDKSSLTLRIHPLARFANGDPVTAADVMHSFDMLTSKHADPHDADAPVRRAGRRRARRAHDPVRPQGPLQRHDLQRRDATAGVLAQMGARCRRQGQRTSIRSSTITRSPAARTRSPSPIPGDGSNSSRNKDYWARDLGVRRGLFNFDRIVYRYYQDNAVAMEAFKAGEFDLLQEYSARRWARQHAGPKWRDGRIVKATFPNGFGAGLQSYLLNLRRPLFQDRRVREALGYTYDFDSVNAYRQYRRTYSMFSNSEFAATGLPGPGELALLAPFRAELPAEVFGPAWQPPRTDGGPDAMRRNLVKARALLEEAGWKVAPDGVLRNAKGQRFEFEYLEDIGGAGRTAVIVAAQPREARHQNEPCARSTTR